MRPYVVIYADPPWRYNDARSGFGGASDHYSTMPIDDIKAVAVPAAVDSVLFLWCVMPLLREALDIVEAWGFTFKTTAFTWIKLNPSGRGLATGLGWWTRANAELCLLATRGRPRPISHRVHSVVLRPRGRHSTKPAEVRERIVELMGPVRRLELFARERVRGWDAWGNEIEGGITVKARRPCRSRADRRRKQKEER
jgi:site-specific DNA-methyltransferase (adenine-specific)